MKIAIIGTGAVGGYFGAKLAQAGFSVNFLARGKQLAAIPGNGLTIKSILGDFQVSDLQATDKISKLGLSDLIIIGTKAWQIVEIREPLQEILKESSIILPLQNGVLAAEELAISIDKKQIIGGVCRIISKMEAPGVINHFGATPSIVFGALEQTEHQVMENIKSIFDQAGIESRISHSIKTDIWKKFAFICVGGLMAVSRSTLGEIRSLPETRGMLENLITEILTLARKIGIELGVDFIKQTLDFIDSLPADTTFSMARDIWDGRPSELDYLNGAVVQLGEKYQVETPINRFVNNVLKPLELKARSSQ